MTEATNSTGLAAVNGMIQQAPTGSGDPQVLAAQAESLLLKGRLEEAENEIRLALKDPKWEYFLILGRVWSAQNRVSDAEEAFRHALSLGFMDSRTHWRLSEFLLKKGVLQEAESLARKAISLKPSTCVYHATLGAVLLAQGRLDEAHSSLRRAIRLNRQNPKPRELLAKVMGAKGEYRGAEKALKKALAIAPNSVGLLGSLITIFEKQGKTDEAVACTRKILAIDPSNARIHIQICNQYRRAGRLVEAEQEIRAALALQPKPENYTSLSHILAAQSRTTEAIAAMAEACRLEPEKQSYRERLAKLTLSNTTPAPHPPDNSTKRAAQSDSPAPRSKQTAWTRIFSRR